ncbi:hypothetical protein JOS77_30550 [Chromobacterium haemolyticum]|nr:hypothetical protein JOS77_30550 [Chromobacterium haemolyticum]
MKSIKTIAVIASIFMLPNLSQAASCQMASNETPPSGQCFFSKGNSISISNIMSGLLLSHSGNSVHIFNALNSSEQAIFQIYYGFNGTSKNLVRFVMSNGSCLRRIDDQTIVGGACDDSPQNDWKISLASTGAAMIQGNSKCLEAYNSNYTEGRVRLIACNNKTSNLWTLGAPRMDAI